jgi:galactokinase/mevalonate kinase-like predicted kinase
MTNENSYLQQMEDQLKIINTKINRSRLETSQSQAKRKFQAVSELFNDLRQMKPEQFEAKKSIFEKSLNELSQMVTDNSALGQVKG